MAGTDRDGDERALGELLSGILREMRPGGLRLYDMDGLAELLGVSRRTLGYRMQKGLSMPEGIRIGRQVRYAAKDIEAWLGKLKEEGETGTEESAAGDGPCG